MNLGVGNWKPEFIAAFNKAFLGDHLFTTFYFLQHFDHGKDLELCLDAQSLFNIIGSSITYRNQTGKALRDMRGFETMTEDWWCSCNLAQTERSDGFNTVLFFVRSIILAKMLLYQRRLDLTLHKLEILSHRICVHLLGNHFEQVLITLHGKFSCRIRPKQGLQQLNCLFWRNLNLLKHSNERSLDLLANIKKDTLLNRNSSHENSKELLTDHFVQNNSLGSTFRLILNGLMAEQLPHFEADVQEFRPRWTALNRLVNLFVEEIVLEERLGKFLDQLEAQFRSAAGLDVDFRDKQGQTLVQPWVDIHGFTNDCL